MIGNFNDFLEFHMGDKYLINYIRHDPFRMYDTYITKENLIWLEFQYFEMYEGKIIKNIGFT